jgi:hypothetical protein
MYAKEKTMIELPEDMEPLNMINAELNLSKKSEANPKECQNLIKLSASTPSNTAV